MTIFHQQVYDKIAAMLNAGIDLKKALGMAADVGNRELRDAVLALVRSIDRGDTLSGALARQSKSFPLADRTLIDAGERSGRLPRTFQALADWYRLKTRLIMIVRSGLIRPLLTLLAAAFIMPAPVFFRESTGAYILDVLILLIIFFAPSLLMILMYRKADKQGDLRIFIDKMLFKIPLLGKALRNMALGRYCFGFRMLFEAGVPVENCAQVAAGLCGNNVISGMVREGAISAKKGNPVSQGFSSGLPEDFLSIWKVGEESGRLGETLKRLYEKQVQRAEYYFKEFSAWVIRFVSALTGLIMIWYILSSASVFISKI